MKIHSAAGQRMMKKGVLKHLPPNSRVVSRNLMRHNANVNHFFRLDGAVFFLSSALNLCVWRPLMFGLLLHQSAFQKLYWPCIVVCCET